MYDNIYYLYINIYWNILIFFDILNKILQIVFFINPLNPLNKSFYWIYFNFSSALIEIFVLQSVFNDFQWTLVHMSI